MDKIDLTYEEAIEELEEILNALEEDNLTLKESMEKFKRGIALYNYSNEILNSMEGEIQVLVKNDKGDLEEKDFNMEV
ncbi:MAG: exodeoxyribonuclease VII small subunit [Tissierellia bacterium]|nr:exodeoxyribonuclease VII small subunit [Tissierellia bacterium]